MKAIKDTYLLCFARCDITSSETYSMHRCRLYMISHHSMNCRLKCVEL